MKWVGIVTDVDVAVWREAFSDRYVESEQSFFEQFSLCVNDVVISYKVYLN